jgi:hypothetical protein
LAIPACQKSLAPRLPPSSRHRQRDCIYYCLGERDLRL